jgi:hypothetical protein
MKQIPPPLRIVGSITHAMCQNGRHCNAEATVHDPPIPAVG